MTNRISPGYAGWDTAEQQALWALCPGEPIGVTLNGACFMTPVKSITFLVGIGPRRASITISPSAGAAGCATAPTAARPPTP